MIPGSWFACEFPERPTEALTAWHGPGVGCEGCRIKALVVEARCIAAGDAAGAARCDFYLSRYPLRSETAS